MLALLNDGGQSRGRPCLGGLSHEWFHPSRRPTLDRPASGPVALPVRQTPCLAILPLMRAVLPWVRSVGGEQLRSDGNGGLIVETIKDVLEAIDLFFDPANLAVNVSLAHLGGVIDPGALVALDHWTVLGADPPEHAHQGLALRHLENRLLYRLVDLRDGRLQFHEVYAQLEPFSKELANIVFLLAEGKAVVVDDQF